jgi:hypothetical protein
MSGPELTKMDWRFSKKMKIRQARLQCRMQAFFVPEKSEAEFAVFRSLSMLSPCFDLAVLF